MKMSNLFRAGALSVLVLTVLWSCQDDFTEEDLLDKQASLGKDSIDFSVLVYDASTSFTGSADSEEGQCVDCREKSSGARAKGVASLTVTISKNGKAVSATTNANGIALFKGLQPGSVVGSVSGAGFTTTNFTVSIKEGESSNGSSEPTTNAGAIIPVFETEGDNVATVTGRATFEGNLLNDEPEPVPNGTKIAFSIDTSSDSFKNLFKAILDLDLLSESVTSASVDNLSFEGSFVATTTNGAYSINLPTSHHGLDYTYTFSDFTADQSIAINNYENRPFGELRRVEVISTQFSQNNVSFDNPRTGIPFISPVQLDIDAPPAAGSGAAATASLLPAPVALSFTVLAAGSGYTASSTTIPVTVNGGSFDNTVTGATAATLTASSDSQGRITGVGGTLGLGYRSQATLTIGGGGTGAIVRVNYHTTVAPLFSNASTAGAAPRTSITSGGSGYVVAPQVIFRGRDFTGSESVVSLTATVSNGAVVSFPVPSNNYVTEPVISFLPQQRVTAEVSVSIDEITSSISSVFITNSGSGYNSLATPNIAIRQLRPGGTGASIVAFLGGTGSFSGVQILSGGSGYSFLSNANFPDSRQPFTIEGNSVLTLRAGATRILNAYYGTGVRTRGTDYND
jgi:hypothetical protein